MQKNQTFYLDTEFNGHGGELMSLALVSPMGPVFYEELTLPKNVDPWVAAHVVPKFTNKRPMPYTLFRTMFQIFISGYANPLIICDWHADANHFLKLLEGPDFGSSLDFECRINILKTPPGQPVSDLPHNALADAKALMNWHHRSDTKYNEAMS